MFSPSAFRATDGARHHLQTRRTRLVETVHRPDTATGWHSHRDSRLCLVVAGEFEEQDLGGSWRRRPGTLLLYPAQTAHENRFSGHGARCLNIEVAGGEIPETGGSRTDGVLELGHRQARLGMRIYDEVRSGAGGEALGVLVGELVSTLQPGSGEEADSEIPTWLERARDLVEESAADDVSLSELVDTLGVSRFVLARRFREYTGCSVGEYRHQVLIRRARHALLATDASLSTIAYRLGFADQSHFTRIFKRLTSLPPGWYRDVGR